MRHQNGDGQEARQKPALPTAHKVAILPAAGAARERSRRRRPVHGLRRRPGRGSDRGTLFEDQGLVSVVAPLAEELRRVRQLVVDLEVVPVGVVKIDALLAHVVDGADDRDPVLLQGEVRVRQRGLAPYVEGDVMDAHAARYHARRRLGILDGEEVHGVALPLERHEDAAVLGVLLHNLEAENRRVEGPRPLHVAHAQRHMADPVESNHRPLLFLPLVTLAESVPRAECSEASGAPVRGQATPDRSTGESRRMTQRATAWRIRAAAMAAANACAMPARSSESARTKKKPANAKSPSSSPRSTRMAGPGPPRWCAKPARITP